MGACLSSTGDSIHGSNSAIVISIDNADMRSYPTPIFVSEVLRFEKPSFFLCNSDHLYYDEHISALDSEEQLDVGQIYFILPNAMLGHRLSASDMAALAVKASLVLDSNINAAADSHNNKNNARISPLVLMETSNENKVKNNVGSLRVSRSRSIRKMQKRSLKKGGLGVGSFKLVLSTIYENDHGFCDDDEFQLHMI